MKATALTNGRYLVAITPLYACGALVQSSECSSDSQTQNEMT